MKLKDMVKNEGLEKVNGPEDLREGDRILTLLTLDSDQDASSMRTNVVRRANKQTYFDTQISGLTKEIYFLEKASRFTPVAGTFGRAVLDDGTEVAGFWDGDLDFTIPREDGGYVKYIDKSAVKEFTEVAMFPPAEMAKTSDLEPGMDPEPDRSKSIYDKQGDEWIYDTEQGKWRWIRGQSSYYIGDWDDPSSGLLDMAPFRLERGV